MGLRDAARWSSRAAAVYALGVWTMIGSYAYFRYTGRLEDAHAGKDEGAQEPADPNQVVYQTAHSKTTIIYKKDFVPYTTRIYNFFNPSVANRETSSRDGAMDDGR